MTVVLCVSAFAALGVLTWFLIPYSPLRRQFEKEVELLTANAAPRYETFSEEALAAKPELLRKHIRYRGLYNEPMMKYSFAEHKDADFLLRDGRPMVKMRYEQVNPATVCGRAAFIDIKIGGIVPFQGLDDYINGSGRMKGVLGKLFTVFDVRGEQMDASALVTVLAEGIFCPSFFMSDDILWEEIDGRRLRASLTRYGTTVGGIFEFDDNGAIVAFRTKDRYEESGGTMIRRDWRVECGGYEERRGLKYPTAFRAFWICGDYEKMYYSCDRVIINYCY